MQHLNSCFSNLSTGYWSADILYLVVSVELIQVLAYIHSYIGWLILNSEFATSHSGSFRNSYNFCARDSVYLKQNLTADRYPQTHLVSATMFLIAASPLLHLQ